MGLRICVRTAPSLQNFSPASRAAARTNTPNTSRALSTTPCRRDNSRQTDDKDAAESQSIAEEDEDGNIASSITSKESAAIAAHLDSLGPQQEQQLERLGLELARSRAEGTRFAAIKKRSDFWYDDDPDTEMHLDESHEPEENDHEDISTSGHAKFEQFREYREYARLAAWQLPLLSSKLPVCSAVLLLRMSPSDSLRNPLY